MSPGRRRNAAERRDERVIVGPAERRQAMLDVVNGARSRLILSLFRCDDFGVLDALAAALDRGVKVEAILTARAKGGQKRLRRLWEALEEMGAVVHRYADPVVKYHAKYLVADRRIGIVSTLNPTKKCFTRTWDFVLLTDDPRIVQSLVTLFALDRSGRAIQRKHRISPRLIVGPEEARTRLRALLEGARQSIRILDHKLSDPDLVALLRERRDAGVVVSALGRVPLGPLVPHGKLLLIDQTLAVVGSIAMSALSLDFRREVSIVVDQPESVRALGGFFDELAQRAGPSALVLPGDRGPAPRP